MGKERNQFISQQQIKDQQLPVRQVVIGDRKVGEGQPCFIIAEVGANHRGNISSALRYIELAKEAGADAVKFQHLTHDKIAADTMVYDDWNNKKIGKLSSFYKSAEMPYGWTEKLIKRSKELGIIFLSTPFDKEAVDVLFRAGVPAFKVASYELTDDILLSYIASKGKPVIISTGMSDLEEVTHAVNVVRAAGNEQIIVLHCVSIYPPKFEELNLRAITTLRKSLQLPIGYSDHSEPPYIAASLTSVALGACVIEKHITDERSGGSNDDLNSQEAGEFKRTVEEIRRAEAALSGIGIKQPVRRADNKGDEISDRWARRSIYAVKSMKKGEVLKDSSFVTLRPWGGIEPKSAQHYLGLKLIKPIKAREPFTPGHFKS